MHVCRGLLTNPYLQSIFYVQNYMLKLYIRFAVWNMSFNKFCQSGLCFYPIVRVYFFDCYNRISVRISTVNQYSNTKSIYKAIRLLKLNDNFESVASNVYLPSRRTQREISLNFQFYSEIYRYYDDNYYVMLVSHLVS